MPAQIGGHEKNILHVGVLNLSEKQDFLDTGVGQKLMNPIPAYTKHGFHPGISEDARRVVYVNEFSAQKM